jgi:glycosyltransferase involved in cell wall biosynthesis
VDRLPAPTPLLILIAPNVSEQMGGEAIKALQIMEELEAQGVDFHQITHARVRGELDKKYPNFNITYIEDDFLMRALWKSVVFRMFLVPLFLRRAARAAARIARGRPGAVVHYTSPVSPVAPRFAVPGVPVIVGPINGNIHHPQAFRGRETASYRLRRWFLRPAQLAHRMFFPGMKSVDAILVAGGPRTEESLRMAGCRDEQFRETLDSGIPNRLADEPPIRHEGRNLRFVHNGRLVPHKGTDLIIRSLPRTRNPVELDVIGRGPMKGELVRLVEELGLQDRVHFIEWFPEHSELARALRRARAFVFPSLAEANGIVVQEAMMMGLPTICLDWGGPSLLITPECGILIEPTGEEAVLDGLARAMDQLSEDGQLADRMAAAGRALTLERGFLWRDLIRRWIAIYAEVAAKRACV